MTAPASLRRRATIASTALGAILCLLFSGATLWLVEDYERIMVNEILRGQAEDYSLRLAAEPATPLPRTHRLSGYLRKPGQRGDVPAAWAELPPGLHESENEDVDGIHVGVFDTDAGRLYFVADLRDIELMEAHLEQFLAVVLVLGTLLAGWLGWVLSGRALAPVRALAEAVDAMPVQPAPTALAKDFDADELGRLAGAIDRYQQRLVESDARERAFFADASHELRTPLAVVQGAAEVLLDEPAADARMRGKLQRLERGLQTLTELLEVLLGLARRNEYTLARVSARTLLEESIAALALPADGPRVVLQVDPALKLQVPPRAAALLLRSLLRRLVGAAADGELRVGHGDNTIELAFQAAGATAPPAGARGDEGLGLALLGRLAQQIGWRIVESTTAEGARRIELHLPDVASG
jgi:signal transduction histidine kinase